MWVEMASGRQLTKSGFYAKLKQAPGVLFRKHNGIDGFRGFTLVPVGGLEAPKPTSGFPVAEQQALDLHL
jgi:hypothetical protein